MLAAVRFLVTAFFCVVFGQSAIDKIVDRAGNVEYFTGHFARTPIPREAIPLLLTVVTLIEATAAILCGLGLLSFSWCDRGPSLAAFGVTASGFALVCLMVGQRLARDYAGAAVLATYFAVALLGLFAFDG